MKKAVLSAIFALGVLSACSPRYDLKLDTPKEGQGKVTKAETIDVEAALYDDGETDQGKIRFGKIRLGRMDVDGTAYVVGYDDMEKFAGVGKGDTVYFSPYGKGVLITNELGSYDKYRMVHVHLIEKAGKKVFELKLKEDGKVESKRVK